MSETQNNHSHAIYRYKFDPEFTKKLFEFSKVHQFDDRTTFKESWENWLDDNNDIVLAESRRLKNLGYDGNIMDKMYKSSRYYFRKKSTEKRKPKQRRNYISMDHEILDAMDLHVKNESKKDDFCPASGYDNFCITNENVIKSEVERLIGEGLSGQEIAQKIKKTYKNRYFLSIENTIK